MRTLSCMLQKIVLGIALLTMGVLAMPMMLCMGLIELIRHGSDRLIATLDKMKQGDVMV